MRDLDVLIAKYYLPDELFAGQVELDVLIAKYYLPDELFAGQVDEIVDMLTKELAKRFPRTQAAMRANHTIAKYYLGLKVQPASATIPYV